MQKIKPLFLMLAILPMLTLASPTATKAQGVGIKFSPTRVEDVVDPGQTLVKSVKITNDSGIAQTMYAYLKDFSAEGESGSAKLLPVGSGGETSLASWIDVSQDGIYFEAGEQKEVVFTINVPSTIGPGGYYGALIFGTTPPDVRIESEDKGAALSIAQQAGPLILLQVKGDIDERATVREFNTDKEIYGTPFSVKFISRIEDQGNVHVKPIGMITVTNMFGKEVAAVAFNNNGSNVLPKTIRRFENTWDGKMGFGRYKAEVALTFGTPGNLGGQGMQSLFMEKTFWIVPWKIVIPVSLVLIFLITLIILFLKFYKNKAVRKAMEQMGAGNIRYVRKYQGPSPVLHFVLIMAALLVIVLLLGMAVYFIFLA